MAIVDLEGRVTEAVLDFEQHGVGAPVLQMRRNPAVDEPVYFPPCTADPDLALVLLPDGWLTQEALITAARLYLRRSGERGPAQDEDVVIRRLAPLAPPGEPALGEASLPVFLK